MEEFFFYYSKKRVVRIGHDTHISDEIASGLMTEFSDFYPPQVHEEETPDEHIFYIELPGVKSKDSIDATLEEKMLKIKARPGSLEYMGPSKKGKVKEFRIAIQIPEGTDPESVQLKFIEDKGILIIRVKKRKKARKIPIE